MKGETRGETADRTEVPLRPCGTCYACCIWLGIDAKAEQNKVAVRKFPGQTCTKLDGTNPICRCSVYDNRPKACERYNCAWKSGFTTDLDRPDKAGMLCTVYPGETTDMSMTIFIFAPEKCGELSDQTSPLFRMLNEAIFHKILDVRIVNPHNRVVFHFINGKIYRGDLLKSSEPEALEFVTFNPPLGNWETRDQ